MATQANGVKLKVTSSNQSLSNVEIGEITDITPPSITKDSIETTAHDSSGIRTYIGGLLDFGEVSVTVNYDNSGDHAKLRNLAKLVDDVGTDSDFVIQYPDGSTETFSGIVTGVETSSPIDGQLSATFTIKVTGAVTYAT